MHKETLTEIPARDLTPGMRIPWCDQGATILDVTTRIHPGFPKSSWTRVIYRTDNGEVTRFVDWPHSARMVLPDFDAPAVEEQIEWALRAGNGAAADELRALLVERAV